MKKYYFSVATIFKNESWGMKEWVEHYKRYGVDHIYMVNDDSDDEFLPILQPFIDEGYVTLYHNEIKEMYVGRQVDINNRYFKRVLEDTEWLSVLDMDEYLYCPKQTDIKKMIMKYDDARIGYIEVNWAYFTSNGYIDQPSSVVESFIMRVPYNATVYARAPHMQYPEHIGSNGPKVIFNTKYIVNSIDVHSININANRVNGSFISNENDPDFIINHYQLQSREYWEKIKMHRGDVNHWFRGNIRNFELFEAFDKIGTVEDTRLRDMNTKLNYE